MSFLSRIPLATRGLRPSPLAFSQTPSLASFSASAPKSAGLPHSTRHVPPADVVAHVAEGPVTKHETAGEIAADTVSGAPSELRYRPVRIYRPTKSTMQSAKGKTRRWILDWDVLQGAGRWENKLIGWASSADYMQGTALAFPTREAAVAFAEKQGWEYQVDEPKVAKIPPKNYASNYVHVPGKLRIHHTK